MSFRMSPNAFSNKRWKVTFMKGEGEMYVFAETAELAKGEAFGQYRKRRQEVDMTPMDVVIRKVEFVD